MGFGAGVGPRDKRGLEHGVRAPVFYGNLQEQTGESGFPRKPTGTLFCLLQKSHEIFGNLREFVAENNVGILYSISLLNVVQRGYL